MKVIRAAVVVLLVTGCVKPTEFTHCGDFTCGLGAVCSPDGTRCVAPETVDACRDLADGDRCVYTGISDGVCQQSICIPGGCGNGVIEASLGEVCDDGNFASGDGCRGDCKSAEECGDGIQDLVAGELCDCGSGATSIAGCNGPNADTPGATCRADCTLARCGDGVIDAPTEVCDDGNTDAGDGCRADCTGRWTALESGTLARLKSVAAVSATDAWTVGGLRILHWDGATWASMPSPDVTATLFVAVCARSAQEAFVLGTTPSGSAVYRYTGTPGQGTWTTFVPAGATWSSLFCNATSAWLGGEDGAKHGRVAKWTGAGFTDQGAFSELDVPPSDVWESAEGDLYVATQAAVWKRFQGGWVTAGTAESAVLIAGTTNNDISLVNNSQRGKHFNGTSWSVPMFGNEITAFGLGAGPGETLFVGIQGDMMSCTSTACTSSPSGTTADLRDAVILDANHAFVVGDHGTILY